MVLIGVVVISINGIFIYIILVILKELGGNVLLMLD